MSRLIFIEGTDGTGKTSVANGIVEALKAKGLSAIRIPIMEGSSVGKDYRSQYLTGKTIPVTEALGMLYSVATTLKDVIYPATKLYDVVVVDRSLASFFAYQIKTNGYGWIHAAFYEVVHSLFAGETIYLQVSPEVGHQRMVAGRKVLDVVESKGLEYQRKVAEAYTKCFELNELLMPSLYIGVDTISIEEVIHSAIVDLELDDKSIQTKYNNVEQFRI